MKKVLFLLLASFLVLAACGQEESKSEVKKETKSSSKEAKKENDKRKDDEKKSEVDDKEKLNNKESEDEQNKGLVNENSQPQEQYVQKNTQEPIQSQEQQSVRQEPSNHYEPTDQEKMEVNAEVAKEHGYTGIPNGDAGLLEPSGPASNEPLTEEELNEYQELDKEAAYIYYLMNFINLAKYILAMLFSGIVCRFNIHIAYKTLLAKLGDAFFHPLAELLISMR